ncbi:hypothetical protein [Porticoccus hydrocarbonoclasticus]|uniref:hypothetical protein n=1 Tax=Porticoccus hydrocarbonoclasticus TaxID=1073414 RepID=UPI0012692A40|nr:hypothetical protein [Porticoccus hydrocarbonoclasticus]
MHEDHPKIRRHIVIVSAVVLLLFATGDVSYTLPQINITLQGEILWPILALAQFYTVVKGYLTAAINGVVMPWNIPRKGPWGDKSVWNLPEYWYVFFNQAIPIAAYILSFVIIFIQLFRAYA